jgi:15-cis-phytoene synthase
VKKSGDIHYQTFKQGSKTYFNSSIFFPEDVRRDVFVLYGFVRVADNFVDEVPQRPKEFYTLKEAYHKALEGTPSGDPIIDEFIALMARKRFQPEWVDAFLRSMEMDLEKSEYSTLEETLEYIYGSAEVIGLFMASILELPGESHYHARMLGRSMQYINFIRDIKEDLELGRRYLPLTDSSLESLEEEYVSKHREEFIAFHRRQIGLYKGWHREAEKGYRFIPRRYLIPIKTAEDMYLWTAERIEKDPFIVYKGKVKPAKIRIFTQIMKNFLTVRGAA